MTSKDSFGNRDHGLLGDLGQGSCPVRIAGGYGGWGRWRLGLDAREQYGPWYGHASTWVLGFYNERTAMARSMNTTTAMR